MPTTTFTVNSPHDGLELYVKEWVPEGEVVGTVQIITGMAEYIERYDHVAEALGAAGYAVYGHDHRGQGKTVKSEEDLGHFGPDGWRHLVDDMRAVHDFIAERHPDAAHFMFGHSMGSFLTQTYLYTHPATVHGAVLQGSESGGFWVWPVMMPVSQVGGRLRGMRARTWFVPWLQEKLFNAKYKPKRTQFDWLSTDEAVVDAYIADPLCGWTATHGFFLEMSRGMLANNRQSNLRRIPSGMPLLIMGGSMDPMFDFGNALKRLRRQYVAAGLTRIESKVYEGMRHELHNHPESQQVFGDLIDWLDRQRAVVEEQKSAA
jgi:alpha-beta hydrolase superfamily lysophospholipase